MFSVLFPFLFALIHVPDTQNDPTEHVDLANQMPQRLANMKARLAALAKTIWHRTMPPLDPQCNATAYGRYGGFLGPWLQL
jgi:hypothetical protein